MMRTVAVPFCGLQDGVHPATWGQTHTWTALEVSQPPDQWNLVRYFTLPQLTDLDAVTSAWSALVGRHVALRTRLFRRHDETRWQRVVSSGTADMEVHGCPSGEDPQHFADAILSEYFSSADRAIAPEDWPARLLVFVTAGGDAYGALLACSHTVLDGWSFSLLIGEFARLLAGEKETDLPSVTHTPVDRAGIEAEGHYRKRSDRGVAYWKSVLEVSPSSLFPSVRHASDSEPIKRVRLRSSHFAEAAATLPGRLGISHTAMFFGAAAYALCRLTGNGSITVQIQSSNRFEPRLKQYVGALAQASIVRIEPVGRTFYDLAREAHVLLLRAYFHGQYDQRDVDRRIKALDQDRDEAIDLSCVFNDVTFGRLTRLGTGSAPFPGEGDFREISWGDARARDDLVKCNVLIVDDLDVPRKCGAPVVDLSRELSRDELRDELRDQLVVRPAVEVQADARYVSPGEMISVLTDMDSVLSRAILADVELDCSAGL